MGKLVCVDNGKKFYLPVESILKVEQGVIKEGEEPVEGYSDYVEISYVFWDAIQTYRIYMSSYSINSYCKSLQAHINLLM